jgi:hypothetical protein
VLLPHRRGCGDKSSHKTTRWHPECSRGPPPFTRVGSQRRRIVGKLKPAPISTVPPAPTGRSGSWPIMNTERNHSRPSAEPKLPRRFLNQKSRVIGAKCHQLPPNEANLEKRSQVTKWRTCISNRLSLKPIHNLQHSKKLASFGRITYYGGQSPLKPRSASADCLSVLGSRHGCRRTVTMSLSPRPLGERIKVRGLTVSPFPYVKEQPNRAEYTQSDIYCPVLFHQRIPRPLIRRADLP